MHPHTQRDSKIFSTGGEDQVKELFTPIWQPHTLGGKEHACMLKGRCILASIISMKFSNIAQDRYIHGKAFSDEALQRGSPHMQGHLNTWARRAVVRETHDHRDPMLIYARH